MQSGGKYFLQTCWSSNLFKVIRSYDLLARALMFRGAYLLRSGMFVVKIAAE